MKANRIIIDRLDFPIRKNLSELVIDFGIPILLRLKYGQYNQVLYFQVIDVAEPDYFSSYGQEWA